MVKTSLFFPKEVIKSYFEVEKENHFKELLKLRNDYESVSEQLLSMSLFIALDRNSLLKDFIQTIIKKPLTKPKLNFEKTYQCSEQYLKGIRNYFKENPHYNIEVRRKGKAKEGKSHIDVVIETDEILIFIEVKYLSDISSKTTFDFARNQIIRNIDVLLANYKRKIPYFVLLTPGIFKNDKYAKYSKLYGYKMDEYMDSEKGIDYMARDSGLDKKSLNKVKDNLFWITFEDDILPLLIKNDSTQNIRSYLKKIFPKKFRKKK
jgi:hypothetical protein